MDTTLVTRSRKDSSEELLILKDAVIQLSVAVPLVTNRNECNPLNFRLIRLLSNIEEFDVAQGRSRGHFWTKAEGRSPTSCRVNCIGRVSARSRWPLFWYPGQDLNLHYLSERGPEPRVSTSSTTRARIREQKRKRRESV